MSLLLAIDRRTAWTVVFILGVSAFALWPGAPHGTRALESNGPTVTRPETDESRSRAHAQNAREYGEGIQSGAAGTYDDPISLDVRRNVRVVYQIKTGAAKDGVAAGLYYLDKLARAYAELGIGEKDRRIVGVFHGDAGCFLLNDAAYEEESGESGGNPNGPIIQKLLDSGVRLELCRSTMQSHGWRGKDVRAGVRIVVGAYPRIIDLQLRGFAYIRF